MHLKITKREWTSLLASHLGWYASSRCWGFRLLPLCSSLAHTQVLPYMNDWKMPITVSMGSTFSQPKRRKRGKLTADFPLKSVPWEWSVSLPFTFCLLDWVSWPLSSKGGWGFSFFRTGMCPGKIWEFYGLRRQRKRNRREVIALHSLLWDNGKNTYLSLTPVPSTELLEPL